MYQVIIYSLGTLLSNRSWLTKSEGAFLLPSPGLHVRASSQVLYFLGHHVYFLTQQPNSHHFLRLAAF